MTVERYRDVSEMPPPPRATGADLAPCIAAAWERAQLGGPQKIPRGVQKFRDIEEAQAARTARTVERLRARRHQRTKDEDVHLSVGAPPR